MIRMLKNLMPRQPLPAHIHFHVDDNGDRVLCDDSVCRPAQRPVALLFPPLR